MNRISTIALGFFLIFAGAQLNIVERYTMTPRMANFFSADGASVSLAPTVQVGNDSPYYQASYSNPIAPALKASPSRDIVPPRWLCWPVLFLGAVILLNGVAMRRN